MNISYQVLLDKSNTAKTLNDVQQVNYLLAESIAGKCDSLSVEQVRSLFGNGSEEFLRLRTLRNKMKASLICANKKVNNAIVRKTSSDKALNFNMPNELDIGEY